MTAWIVQTLVTSTVLMLLVLALRRPVGRWFGARVAYALWLLPLGRMVLPPLPEHEPLFGTLSFSADFRAPEAIAMPVAAADPPGLPAEVQAAFESAPITGGFDWVSLVMAVWLAGAALWFAWQMLRYRLFVDRALAGATHLSTSAGVDVYVSDTVEGPIAAGILRRRIFLPRDFLDRYSSSERRQALLHEGAHHDRKDLVANFAAIATVALHWWNPLAHIAYRAFRADQELACDATVLADAAPEDLHAYGSALVKSTVGRAPAAACAFNRTEEIKRRLTMIKQARIGFGRRMAGAALALGAVAGGLFVTASGSTTVRIEQSLPPAAFQPVASAPKVRAHDAAGMREVRHAAEQARVEAEEARREAIAGAQEARREAMAEVEEARREAAADVEEARREAREAMDEQRRWASEQASARREAYRARAQAARDTAQAAREQARMAQGASRMAQRMVALTLSDVRMRMASDCAAQGHPVSSDERDWEKLALCDKAAFNAHVIGAMEQARSALIRDAAVRGEERDQAITAIDAAISRMKARSAG